jgi:hypothetical protein
MTVEIDLGNLGIFPIDITGVEREDQLTLRGILEQGIESEKRARDLIAEVFLIALDRYPDANPSDIWHHLLYRDYLTLKRGANPNQSWVRASGDAFELVLARAYNNLLSLHGLRMSASFGKKEKRRALERMGIWDDVGSEKIDLIIEADGRGHGYVDGWGIVGAVHAKASLAERVSDDIPASRIMMDAGFLSILCTLDVKSFPPQHTMHTRRKILSSSAWRSDQSG